MSLINDALKRAQQRGQPVRPPTPLKPAEPPKSSSSSILPIVIIIFLLASLAGGGWFFWKWYKGRNETAPMARKAPVVETTQTKIEPAKPESKTPQNAAPTAVVASPTNAVAAPVDTPAPPVAVAPTPAAKPAPTPVARAEVRTASRTPLRPTGPFPNLKLQGIFYNSTKPAVVLNGRSFYIGSKVHGAVVTLIEPESVTLEYNGETRVLELTK